MMVADFHHVSPWVTPSYKAIAPCRAKKLASNMAPMLQNPAIETVNTWIKSGGIASAIAQRAKR